MQRFVKILTLRAAAINIVCVVATHSCVSF